MKKIMQVLIALTIVTTMLFISPNAQAKTTTLNVKSTVDVLNIREKASTKSKVIGKLKKIKKLFYYTKYMDNIVFIK